MANLNLTKECKLEIAARRCQTRSDGNGNRSKNERTCSGFSILEVAIAIVIIMVVAAIAIPNFVRAMNSYRLTSSARNVSDLIQRARYEAIKQNTKVSCHFSLGSLPRTAWVDINRTGSFAGNDPETFYPAQILSASGSLPSASSMGFPNNTTVANTGVITFDSRGAVDYTGVVGGPTVWVLYFTYNNDASYGAKAVTVEPLGRTKVWSAAPGSSSWSSQ